MNDVDKIKSLIEILVKQPSQKRIDMYSKSISRYFQKKFRKERNLIREAVANYMVSEGCSCCQDTDKHKEDNKRLAELLKVPEYNDGSGYDFYKFKK